MKFPFGHLPPGPRRDRLQAAVIAKMIQRGRPLTDAEKMANLRRWLGDGE